MAKRYRDKYYEFYCDICGDILSAHKCEKDALQLARNAAKTLHWKWFHPHWGLKCDVCLEEIKLDELG